MSAAKPLVAVVDDDALVRESICMLAASHDYETLGFAGCQEFLDSSRRGDVDCLILDVRLPGLSGPELQDRLLADAGRLPVPPIIFISGHGTVPLAVQSMRLGALDFLQKPFDEAALLDRIGQAVGVSASRRRERQQKSALAARRDNLSPREREVLDALAAGLANKQIADRFGISIRTVEQHRANLKKKLQARTLADLLRDAGPADAG